MMQWALAKNCPPLQMGKALLIASLQKGRSAKGWAGACRTRGSQRSLRTHFPT